MKILVTGAAGFIGMYVAQALLNRGDTVVGLDNLNDYYDVSLKEARLAGFIGMYVAQALLNRGDTVVGLDNLNDYYDVSLKEARLRQLQPQGEFSFVRADVANADALTEVFRTHKPQRVVHLAAQAGVRYSLTNPQAYIQSNLVGFANILEACRHHSCEHLVYASSSSVYGGNQKLPFSEHDSVDHPVSLYAATKKSNELMAHTYSHLYGLPTTGLRFFTVYGPWGRPWAIFSSRGPFWKAGRSKCSIMAGCSAISPTSMTLWKALYASLIERPSPTHPSMRSNLTRPRAKRRTLSTT
jgi:nucleoside-diphosphate-sugar epimerase